MRGILDDVGPSLGSTITGVLWFGGRARIRDVVYFCLAAGIVQLFTSPFFGRLAWDWNWLADTAIRVIVALPMFALFCRRLHDQGRSGWWALIVLPLMPVDLYQSYRANFAVLNPEWLTERSPVDAFMPWLMGLALISMILFVWPGQKGANRYGPDPRETPQPSNARVAASTSS